MKNIRHVDIGKEISIDVKVSNSKQKFLRLTLLTFECARCKNIVYVPQDIYKKKVVKPFYCVCDEKKKGVFRLLENESEFVDFREIFVYNENKENSIKVVLQNNLVNSVEKGDYANITGVLKAVPHNSHTVFDYVLEASMVRKI